MKKAVAKAVDKKRKTAEEKRAVDERGKRLEEEKDD